MRSSPARNNANAVTNSNVSKNSSLLVSVSSPSSCSASSCSFSPIKSMEEVWNHITLASLTDNRPTASFSSATLQDFFLVPSIRDRPSRTTVTRKAAPLAPPPANVLSLDYGSDFHLPSLGKESFGHPPVAHPSLCKKRVPGNEDEKNLSERRNKRLMKNRESAARSRARKQAYTNELELAVTRLREENAKLRRQQQQAKFLAAPDEAHFPNKRALYRTLTAPF